MGLDEWRKFVTDLRLTVRVRVRVTVMVTVRVTVSVRIRVRARARARVWVRVRDPSPSPPQDHGVRVRVSDPNPSPPQDHVFTPRLVTLVFVWSRMRVVDEVKRRVRLTNHHFEDFLESLVRVAVIKPWPSAEEIRQAGCLDAGHFIIKLQSELAAQAGTEASPEPYPEPQP